MVYQISGHCEPLQQTQPEVTKVEYPLDMSETARVLEDGEVKTYQFPEGAVYASCGGA
jgi:hypothetical protein